jgi:hypothetical protein
MRQRARIVLRAADGAATREISRQAGARSGRRRMRLDQPPPAGYANWTAPLLPRELVDIHEQCLWRFLRAQQIDLSRSKFRPVCFAGGIRGAICCHSSSVKSLGYLR